MPNDCENTLTITGAPEDLNAFHQFARAEDEELVINNFIPIPEELLQVQSPNRDLESARKMTKAHGFPDWYQWRCHHWGTRGEPYETLKREINDEP